MKTNLAFKEQRFQQKNRERVHIGRVSSSAKFLIRPKFFIAVIFSIAALLAVLIFNMVETSEMTSKIYSLKKQYKAQKNEFVRLTNILENRMNKKAIETYAIEKLHMRKISNKQISYISTSKGNLIELENKNKRKN